MQTLTDPKLDIPDPPGATLVQHQHFHLSLVDNGRLSIGILLAEQRLDVPPKIVLEKVRFYRHHDGTRDFALDGVEFGSYHSLYVCATKEGNVLPLPSRSPYVINEIDESDYLRIRELCEDKGVPSFLNGLEHALKIIAEHGEFRLRKTKFVGGERKLDTPPGYADQEQRWYDMPKRFDPVKGL